MVKKLYLQSIVVFYFINERRSVLALTEQPTTVENCRPGPLQLLAPGLIQVTATIADHPNAIYRLLH
jgi:hypothetical protein